MIAALKKTIEHQMDLDYARHGVSIVEDDYTSEVNGDTFYGNVSAVTFAAGSSANAILLHKKGHGPSAAIT
mgnify:CR=1 FL=1